MIEEAKLAELREALEEQRENLRKEIAELCAAFPIYADLTV